MITEFSLDKLYFEINDIQQISVEYLEVYMFLIKQYDHCMNYEMFWITVILCICMQHVWSL